MPIQYKHLSPDHFASIIALGNHVHGDNYLDSQSIERLYQSSWQNDINASWVAIDEQDNLIGFRLTVAPNHWTPDQWCSPKAWVVNANEVSYFKCNTVAESVRGQGVGSALLKHSIESSKLQGAKAGLAHIWLASPGNSAFRYFSACGGKLVKKHANKWQALSIEDNYQCPVCGDLCECTAAEMILPF
jgi:predicted GNAT family acetyltransferase